MKKIQQIDCIELLKSLPNNSVDLIFTDPPYNLSTQWVIDEYGKPNPKTKAIDFMGKWDGLNGKILEEWFKEANRVLKYGGRVLMFGMDRQIWVNCYYANFSGLVQQQSLYWYFASSFPKAADLSKMIDKVNEKSLDTIIELKQTLIQLFNSSSKTRSQIDAECGFRASNYLTLPSPDKRPDPWVNILPSVDKWRVIKNVLECDTDISSRLDALFYKAEREIIGSRQKLESWKYKGNNVYNVSGNDGLKYLDVTIPSTQLAQKYDGFKYSISPVKQTNETIMVFQKPYKTGSAMHDTLAYENGDKECCCGALNIDGSRLETSDNLGRMQKDIFKPEHGWNNHSMGNRYVAGNESGRFPAQTFCDSETAKLLDEQSGIKQSAKSTKVHTAYGTDSKFGGGLSTPDNQYDDVGGCSKILHKCDYDDRDIELYYYSPKVDKKERNMGNIENNHPTIKPINLLIKILNLFKTPNPQVCVDTFAGSGSIPIAAELLGFEVIAGDLDEGFVEIANTRLDYAIKNKTNLLKKHKQPEPIKPSSNNQSFF